MAAGAVIIPWSPLSDDLPPSIAAVFIGGGGVDARARGLAANTRARAGLAAFAAAGGVVIAEGGGLAYTALSLELAPSTTAAAASAHPHPTTRPLPMAAIFPFRCRVRGPPPRKPRDAPVEVVTTGAVGWLPRGLRARGAAARRYEVLVEASLGDGLTGPPTPLAPRGGNGDHGGESGGGDDDDDGEWSASRGDDTGRGASGDGSSNSGGGGGGGVDNGGSGHAPLSSSPPSPPWVCAFTARRAAPGAPPTAEGYVRGRALATALRLHYPSCPRLLASILKAAGCVDVAAATAASSAAAERAAAAAAAAAPRSTSGDSWPAGGSPDAYGAARAPAPPPTGLPRSASVRASPDRGGGLAAAAARAGRALARRRHRAAGPLSLRP